MRNKAGYFGVPEIGPVTLGGWMFPGVCIAIPHRRDNGKQFSMHRSVLMEPRPFQYMVEAAGGQKLSDSPDTWVRRVCTDSRQVQAGDLFVPLSGERFDGHAFLPEVLAKGVAGIVVERNRFTAPSPVCGVIAVENTRAAFGRMAGRYREDFDLPVIAVAGSNGKTTTKEILATVLRQRFKTLSSQASFNNDVGVPKTLFELTREHEVAVLEFGTNHPGELAPLLRLAGPSFGVLTSIGREHLEFFHDLDGVIEEEGWLAELLPDNGRLFLNGDTPGADRIARRSRAPIVTVGFATGNAWQASDVRMEQNNLRFQVLTQNPEFARGFEVPLLGRHQVTNVLLTLAVAEELGLSAREAQEGLAQCRPAKMRLQPWRIGEVQVLDDSYNANPDSMRAALDTLRAYPCRGRRLAVLGDMAELGNQSSVAHSELGEYTAALGLDYLLTIGRWGTELAAAARRTGKIEVRTFDQVERLAQALQRTLRPGDVVLLKASRAVGLDRVGNLLQELSGVAADNDLSQGPTRPGKV